MALNITSTSDLWKLVDELKKPFEDRDTTWKDRRNVRFRRMQDDLTALPLNPRVADTALMVYQDESSNQEVHKRVKRLVANKPRFEVVIYDDSPKMQRLGQDIEDGLKALYKWMNRGKTSFDWKVTQYQQGDGLGIGKVMFVPGHGDVLGEFDKDDIGEDEMEAYDKATEDALRKELPPFRVVAVNPLSCYWWEDDDGIEVVAEVGEKTLNPLLEVFSEYGLRYDSKNHRLYTDDNTEVAGGQTVPAFESKNLGQRVTYIEIRTRDKIAILVEHPQIRVRRGQNVGDLAAEERGVTMVFDNPFGPYTTGYVLVPADETTEDKEVDRFQPPVLASLNSAQALNVLMTAQLSAALENALSPVYVKVAPDQTIGGSDEDKSPEESEGEIPVVPGEIKRIEKTAVELERVQDRILGSTAPYLFQEALSGEATSDTSGHRLAIQVAQADIQMVPYQNARAEAIKELMMGILYAIRRHGLSIYIPTIPDSVRTSKNIRSVDRAKLTPDMADVDFELIVTLGSETPVTKYAKWQALQQREEAGTAGYQTVIENSDVENPEDEIIRVFEGKMLKSTMEETIGPMAKMIATAVQTKLQSFIEPPEVAQAPAPDMMGVDPTTGLANGGGTQPEIAVQPRLPGLGLPVAGPSNSDFGPAVPMGGGEQVVSG